MFRFLILISISASAASVAIAQTPTPAGQQTITDPNEIAARLHFWTAEDGEPVYYGEVRSVDPRTAKPLGHYQCLAIAFIKYEAGVFSYAHKMWSKSPDGSCRYNDVTTKKVGNHGICVKDTNAGFGRAVGTARMSKENIDFANSKFRTIDTNTKKVGETKDCIPPNGVGDNLYSVKIEGGRFKLMTKRPLDYELSLDVQDPKNPPTKPVL